jgi:hypothetical protein
MVYNISMTNQNYIREIANRIRAKANCTSLTSNGIEELFDTYAVLALAKGPKVTDEDVHDAWSAWATKFDPRDGSIIPFEELSPKIKGMDSPYKKAICSVAATLPEFKL